MQALAQGRPSIAPRIRTFLLGFLDAVSDHDGFVEAFGATESAGLLIQGWSAP